ncbi:Cysteine desulfurase IscS [Rhodovastum atsumiense]|uniref:Cysteine desulfurase n=1 Tax=Rhodovastum atsumiense TaxID=504468 RepID=A0A5M6IUG2_9PROT|nr:cysteine desulfurase family protein [Rhodovastum atsumiense]KAA5611963.1 cysteine desulfurase [Rhodovastum atsumiense]CAH2598741.1 Cysteine desulfurase IscS [Rhodovastum atsumiense]
MVAYLDNAATTPLDPRVGAAMAPWISGMAGNPSSLHAPGREARAAVEAARAQVAALLGARREEIIFTASGTEADNLALIGTVQASGSGRHHLVVGVIEHPAVIETARFLERQGVDVSFVPVDGFGRIDPDAVRRALRPHTRLISVMAASNVVGTLQPIAEIGRIARDAGIPFHTDAVQAAGKLPLDLAGLPVDLLSVSAHKLHGPKGVGALYVRTGVTLEPIIHGGGQEHGLRSATENVAGIVGLGRAAELARSEMAEDNARLVHLRDRLIEGIRLACPQAYLIGDPFRRLPGHACLGFAGQEGEAIRLLLALDEAGIAVSTGSACSAARGAEPSYVLQAMGFDALRARGALRLTLGRFNTAGDVDLVLERLPALVGGLRPLATARA